MEKFTGTMWGLKSLRWKHIEDGNSSLNKVYKRENNIAQGVNTKLWKKNIWKNRAPTQIKCLLWLLSKTLASHAKYFESKDGSNQMLLCNETGRPTITSSLGVERVASLLWNWHNTGPWFPEMEAHWRWELLIGRSIQKRNNIAQGVNGTVEEEHMEESGPHQNKMLLMVCGQEGLPCTQSTSKERKDGSNTMPLCHETGRPTITFSYIINSLLNFGMCSISPRLKR